MASLAGDGTALGHIARRRGSPDVALRWVSPDGGTEDWSYARVWAAAIFAARKMPPRPEASKDDGAPWCVGLMVQEGPMLAVMELAVILAVVLVPLPEAIHRADWVHLPGLQFHLCYCSRRGAAVRLEDALQRSGKFSRCRVSELTAESPPATRSSDLSDTLPPSPGHCPSPVFLYFQLPGRPRGCVATHRALLAFCN